MKSKTVSAILLALLLSATATAFSATQVKADPYPMPGIKVWLETPDNQTFNTSTVSIDFGAIEVLFQTEVTFFYSLDHSENKSIQNVRISSEQMRLLYADVVYVREMKGSFVLSNLQQGWHALTVYCQTPENASWKFGGYFYSDSINFYAKGPPVICILSLENKTFDSPDIPLTLAINQSANIKYSLDGLENTTINGNTTLSNLQNGAHNITIYAIDDDGNVGISNATFTVSTPTPEPLSEPIPAVAVVVAVSTVAIVVVITSLLCTKEARGKNKKGHRTCFLVLL
jgi:hypothetical protein